MTREEILQLIEELKAAAGSPQVAAARRGAQDLQKHDAAPGVREAGAALDAKLADWVAKASAAAVALEAALAVGFPALPDLEVSEEVFVAIEQEFQEQLQAKGFFAVAAALFFGNVTVHPPEPEA